MSHTEVECLLDPVEPWRDITMVELEELGYEGFEEITGGLRAYIPTEAFRREALAGLLAVRDPHVVVDLHVRTVEPRNWNAEWESSFQPVEVGDRVRIRAHFHPADPRFEHELVITPRMAFGTGHHATTRMMVRAMLDLDLKGQQVCDLGCGTGVLAILAERLGAEKVHAVDNDPTAVDNARETVVANGCTRVLVEKGDVANLAGRRYGTILANIERNTLMRDMQAMADALLPGGALLLSGFVTSDRHMMAGCAKQHGLEPMERLSEGDWALLGCRRTR